ncbi:hypothetical protein H8R29_16000 [Priestia megaterium]|uniref:Uncharacterized protein n=1 Tax=Priestia megaterium (strain ATCC 14581 / DSM 32 / CCUG 1817 / JCM 2506 / NBRC 15308 / NCIMB 9376 / NCTC 10342 / NRRL B-14308 / VKM B-512 / Ford 19) TaxID=1348623 RepID=A0A0B6A5L8_PRIM2|nr:hypothetical protein [Priestia megaterium]AJI20250.1 hypothetical protein BG04_5511 [Priestia megaterium NBRC 15308 = ATCC 14581]KFN04927.1 hypothetical protein DJ91_3776 [Priestia megaterium]KGJ80418.1 hypothetical protein BMT_19570 [Priestia megaterium NBRC 15308 = ATCC 14581]MDR4231664.1 hypothetical protein [Priestia megaterium]MED3806447.1 hypothetical protein [Priestia megaterium]
MSVYIKSISIGTISGGIVIFGNAGNISPPSGSTSGSGSSSNSGSNSQMPMPPSPGKGPRDNTAFKG